MRRLFIKNLTSIGAVESGDNPDAEILFYKHHPENTSSVEPEGRIGMAEKPDLSGLDPDLKSAVDAYVAAEIEKGLTPDVDDQVSLDDLPEDVRKSIEDKDAEIQKRDAEMAELRKDLESMRDEQLTERFTARAGDFASVLGNDDETGEVLKSLYKAAPEAYQKLDDMLGNTVAALKSETGAFMKELGSAEDVTDVSGRIDAIAKTLTEADPNLTHAQARAEAWTRNPDLYDEYQDSRRQVR